MNFKSLLLRLVPVFFILTAAAEYEELDCYPTMQAYIKNGDELVIAAPSQHKYVLGLSRPDSTSAIIIDPSFDLNPNNIVGFNEAGEINLAIKHLKAASYKDGELFIGPAFTTSGLYCLHFSSNFETEIENSFFILLGFQWPSPQAAQDGQFYDECIQREW